jgi:hypothetical protein
MKCGVKREDHDKVFFKPEYNGDALITRVLIPAVLIPNNLILCNPTHEI